MRKGFTLTEILVVMMIIGVILGLTLTGLDRLASADAMNVATARFEAALLQARAKALSEGRKREVYVALLLPSTNDFRRAGGDPCASYRACYVEKPSGATSYKFLGWIEGQEWQSFGKGIVLVGINQSYLGKEDVTSNPSNSEFDEQNYLINHLTNPVEGDEVIGVDYLHKNDAENFGYYDDVNRVYGSSSSSDFTSSGFIEDVPTGVSSSSKAEDCVGIVFNRYGSIVNVTKLCMVMAEGDVMRLYPGTKQPLFRFRNIFTGPDSGKKYIGNWAEVTFNIFNGMPHIRMLGEPRPNYPEF